MIQKRLLWRGFAVLLLVFSCLFWVDQPISAFAAAPAQAVVETQKTLRVGFPHQAGLSEVDAQGNLTGYTYDYLQEIAQYTGWTYEFVQIPGDLNESLSTMLKMLQAGSLDLLGGLSYNDSLAKIYDYPGYNYGTASTVLRVLAENTDINESNYQSLGTMRVAVYSASGKQEYGALEQFCDASGVALKLVICESEPDQEAALAEGRADAMLGIDIDKHPNLRTIAQFSPQPYYFATTKGKTEIVNTLNFAIKTVNETDPYFSATLYEKYFGDQNTDIRLSPAEQAYIAQCRPLRVVIPINKEPLAYYNPKEAEPRGIAIDYLAYIAANTGLQFTYLHPQNAKEMHAMLNDGRADLLAGVLYDYAAAEHNHVALTRPYLTAQVILVVNNQRNGLEMDKHRLVLPRGFVFAHPQGDIDPVWLPSVAACIDAVDAGMADYTYGNGYAVQFYANQSTHRNISLVPQPSLTQKFSLGVAQPAPVELLTILNKAAGALSDDQLQAIIYRNTVHSQNEISFRAFVAANPLQVLLLGLAFALLCVLVVFYYTYITIRSSRRAALDNERYKQLSELTGEYLFEYDYRGDVMMLSEKSIAMFGPSPADISYRETVKKISEEGFPDYQRFYDFLQLKQDGTADFLFRLRNGDGCWIRVFTLMVRDKHQQVVQVIGKLQDIREEKEELAHLAARAQRDSLTGVYNTATTRQLITDLLQPAKEVKGALLVLDIDHFKTVNDRYGHYTGDAVLQATAKVLQGVCRRDDIVGRLGGDEFIVFLQWMSDVADVTEKCRLLQHAMAEIVVGDEGAPLSVSIGVAMVRSETSYNGLYQAADNALYQVKENGRNGFLIV